MFLGTDLLSGQCLFNSDYVLYRKEEIDYFEEEEIEFVYSCEKT